MSSQLLNEGCKLAMNVALTDFYSPIPTVDFSVILAHLNARKNNSNDYDDVNAIESAEELTLGFIESLQDQYPNIAIIQKPGEYGTTGFVYMLMWFDRFSFNLAKSHESTLNDLVMNTSLEVNALIKESVQALTDKNMPNMSICREGTETMDSYLQMIRIYDVFLENVMDGENLFRLMKKTSDQFFLDFTKQIENAGRSLRNMNNQYFELPSTIA